MGLHCQMFHLRDVDRAGAQKALTDVMAKRGFTLAEIVPLDAGQLCSHVDASAPPAYIVGPRLGRWTPVIDLHCMPWPGDISIELSRACSSFVLSIMLFDDDVLYYNLDHNGVSLDGYNSNPQYFEKQRVPEAEVQAQRHTPEPFEPLLPAGKTVEQLQAILMAGWWQAHDDGTLDDDGVMPDEVWDACPYQYEEERMAAFCGFLELAGQFDYPFADWRENEAIHWPEYRLLQYASKLSLVGRIIGKLRNSAGKPTC